MVEKFQLLARALKDGEVDLFHDSVVPHDDHVKVDRFSPYFAAVEVWRGAFQGVIVVKKNSGITSLADLKGKIIAFRSRIPPRPVSFHECYWKSRS